ncbi:hypothetical protein H8D04_00875 [bacterium]|nr:hypothetical protein [bacterium]
MRDKMYNEEENNTSAEYLNSELIKCELCDKKFKSITNTHLKNKHKITTDEYKLMFPNSKMISDSHFDKFAKWIYSNDNKTHCRKMNEISRHSQKRKDAVKKVVQSDEYRKNHSKLMKDVLNVHPEYRDTVRGICGDKHHHYGKSNWQRWFEKYGKEEADTRLQNWKLKNKIPGGSKNTKIELKVKDILESNGINYIHQYDKIKSYFVDFYLPDFNLVFEVDGDYWHANPNKYNSNELIKYPGNRVVTAQSVWDKDNIRLDEIKKCGYNVCRIFGSDITEENVLKLIQNFGKDIVRTYEKS